MPRSPRTTTLVGRLNLAMNVCWNSTKPVTREDIVDSYKANPIFAGRGIGSIRASAHWDFSGLVKTGMFDVVKIHGKRKPGCKALVLKAKYRKLKAAPVIDQVPGVPKPNGRGRFGHPNIIPNFSLMDLAEKMGYSYSTVYNAVKKPHLISTSTRRRILKAIKDNGGDLSKVTLVKVKCPKKVAQAPAKKPATSWKVIPEQDVKPGDMAIQSKEGRMIFMRSL